jgi:hypothetical protein
VGAGPESTEVFDGQPVAADLMVVDDLSLTNNKQHVQSRPTGVAVTDVI